MKRFPWLLFLRMITVPSVSLEKRYEILDQLLNSEDYQTVERNCTVSLISTEEEKERSWEIVRTYTLENDLVGGSYDLSHRSRYPSPAGYSSCLS